jgi:hypothetical protein
MTDEASLSPLQPRNRTKFCPTRTGGRNQVSTDGKDACLSQYNKQVTSSLGELDLWMNSASQSAIRLSVIFCLEMLGN